MKGLNYRPACDAHGNFLPWLNALGSLSGAYVIRKLGTVVYVGESHTGRLGDTIKRHFYRWKDSPDRKHHTYPKCSAEIAVRLTPPGSAQGAQDNLIRRLKPRDNLLIPAEENPF
jgi:hypothetical protein